MDSGSVAKPKKQEGGGQFELNSGGIYRNGKQKKKSSWDQPKPVLLTPGKIL